MPVARAFAGAHATEIYAASGRPNTPPRMRHECKRPQKINRPCQWKRQAIPLPFLPLALSTSLRQDVAANAYALVATRFSDVCHAAQFPLPVQTASVNAKPAFSFNERFRAYSPAKIDT